MKPKFLKLTLTACGLGLSLLSPIVIAGQTNCEAGNGPLNSTPPVGLSAAQAIEQFAAQEALAKAARLRYTHREEVIIQTLGRLGVDGEFRQTSEVSYDSAGKRLERMVFAPQSSLRRVALGPDDLDDIRTIMPFALTTHDLPAYEVNYAGEQRVDELRAYVFEVAPRKLEKNKRYFQGRIWVDTRDFQIVKTCGRSVPDKVAGGKRHEQDVHPGFVTYRQPIDQFWFPAYAHADDYLQFNYGTVHLRETVKYTNYKKSGN